MRTRNYFNYFENNYYLCGMKTIELLAPARDYEAAVAAIEAGADALYMGGPCFGARQAAGNSLDEIRRVVEYAHRFGVRVHTTLNTLLYEGEVERAATLARELAEIGVDALIVQDMALRQLELPIALHASTQVNNMTPEGARFLEEAGFERVILERGLTFEQIRAICEAAQGEIECFVHGAICVGYSGRCFLSRSMMADRSGNRGACSQSCRLSYDLVGRRGEKIITGKHLLSVRDLNLSGRLGELMDAGVCSFKIEGRLKDVNYIRNVVAYYRAAIDRELQRRPHLKRASAGVSQPDFVPDPQKSFTRGFTEYMFDGKRADVASFDTPKAVGEYIGRIQRVGRTTFRLDRPHTLQAGDGICFAGIGTQVNRVEGEEVEPNRMEGIRPGVELYRNFDRRFKEQVERSRMRRQIAARAEVELSAEEVRVSYTDCEGFRVTATRQGPFAEAEQPERMLTTLSTQLAKAGDTIFRIEEVKCNGEVRFLPASLLAELRRELLEELKRQRVAHYDARPAASLRPWPDTKPRYPKSRLEAEENVTNSVAEAFYRAHGVEEIAPSLELRPTTTGCCVMRSAYCIRREIGACLREGSTLKGPLYLEHGLYRYRLEFDCKRCEMALWDESRKNQD